MRYPEFNEDKILRIVFKGLSMIIGHYLDIGSGGPYSNTEWLRAKGWHGGFIFARRANPG